MTLPSKPPNRLVIDPSSGRGSEFDCPRDFNVFRRACFIVLAFGLSTLITGLFIHAYDGYISEKTMLLSGVIAGGKWAIQIIAGWLLLGVKRWLYIGQLAATCLIGSLTLLPFAVLSGGAAFFFGSLIACILVMTVNLFLRQRATGLSWRWFALWLALLGIAVGLQLTVVFHLL
ncbi:MAG: hypothetical protein V4819_14150 [Verrucomicrobiota bacterium]